MERSILQVILSTTPLIFGVLGFAFIITTFVSRDWVRQDWFLPRYQPLDWDSHTSLYTIYRSPFVLCGANATKSDNGTTTYQVLCHRYKVYGRGQTACQTPNETAAYSNVTGDWRMCQQVHLSGNLILASLVFVCVAIVMLLVLSYFFILKSQSTKSANAATNASGEVHEKSTFRQLASVRVGAYWLVTALSAAAACAFVSQFYAILGLVQSQPDNGAWAVQSLGSVVDSQTGDLVHAPWIQGKALTIYVSLGWFFSFLSVGAISSTWLGSSP
jgi:hypothetical protein